MFKKTIFDSIAVITERVLKRDDVPVSNNVASEVGNKVAKEVAPIVENATNSEPWYRSRIYLGLIAAGLGLGLGKFGITISGDDLQLIIENVTDLVTAGGVLFALYGRIVGTSKPPLGRK